MPRLKRAARSCTQALRLASGLPALPWKVRWFYLRAWRWAILHDDAGALTGSAWPVQVAALRRLAADRRAVVELGTGKALTTVALAVADHERRVISYDTYVWPTRNRYLALAPRGVREHIELRERPAEQGPEPGDDPVELLFIDSSHELDATIAEFKAWSAALAENAVVAFHDYGNPDYPGVAAAVARLGLEGEAVDGMFVWRKGARARVASRSTRDH